MLNCGLLLIAEIGMINMKLRFGGWWRAMQVRDISHLRQFESLIRCKFKYKFEV